MKALSPAVEVKVGAVRLRVVTAVTDRTGLTGEVEVFNGKLLFSDRVNLSRDDRRRRFARRVRECVAGTDEKAVEEALLQVRQDVQERLRSADAEKGKSRKGAVPYRQNGGIFWSKPTIDGTVETPLANFRAEIVQDTIRDDGCTQEHYFEIAATCQGQTKTCTVPAEEFSSLAWIPKQLGSQAIVEPGYGIKEQVRAAIQKLSTNIVERRVYSHTGWRSHEGGGWFYLHAGGGIGANGNDKNLLVDLADDQLGAYSLPDPPKDKRLKNALKASLDMLSLAPKRITYPVFAGIYRAPLAELHAATLSVFLEGESGSHKTSFSAIAQAHYGTGLARNLPEGWSSTANALEKRAFLAKDALFTVDDFRPSRSRFKAEDLHEAADRLLRAQANQQGRARMGDMSNEYYYPRGLILSSGEEVPRGRSLRARMIVVEVSKGDVDLKRLTKAQANATEGLLAEAMSAFLSWLAPQINTLKKIFPKRHEQLRSNARSEATFPHDQTPAHVASLALGLETFLKFAESTEAITDREHAQYWDEGWKVLLDVGKSQGGLQRDEDETQRFFELLGAAISSGKAHLADAKTGDEPADPQRWGWKCADDGTWTKQRECVGWLDGGDILLHPTQAFTVAQKQAQAEGEPLAIRRKTLQKRLADKRLLASRDTDHNAVRRTINGTTKRVLHVKEKTLADTL